MLFSFVQKEKNSGERFVLCAITVSGVVYVIRVKNFSSYVSGSVLPENDVDEFDVQRQNQVGRFRAVAATLGCLAVGREDGTISCFQLGFTIGENAGKFWFMSGKLPREPLVFDCLEKIMHMI